MLAPFLCHECQLDIRRTPRIGSVKHRNIVTSRHLLQVTGSVNESNIVAEPSWGKCFLLDIFRLGEIVLVCASFCNKDRGTSTRRIITADFTTRGSKSLSRTRNQARPAQASTRTTPTTSTTPTSVMLELARAHIIVPIVSLAHVQCLTMTLMRR